MKLLDGEITEQDLIGSSFEQDTQTGKLGNRILVLEATLDNISNSFVQTIGYGDKLEKATREAVKRINEVLGEAGGNGIGYCTDYISSTGSVIGKRTA